MRISPLHALPLLLNLLTKIYTSPVRSGPPPVLDGLIKQAMPQVSNIEHRPGARLGERLVEMDMVLTREQWEAIHGDKKTHKVGRIALGDESYRWRDATIPYEIDNVFDESQRNLIRQSMDDWETYTCVRFIPRQNEKDYVRIISAGGCWSLVGMTGGMQELSIDIPGCVYHHTIVHELGHTIGFHHEQTRPDRDNYIRVHTDHIASGQEYNFEKYEWGFLRNYGIKYDYWSVMHYGQYAFTRNGQKTIETTDPKYQNVIGTVPGASLKDIQTVNLMYRCSEHCDRNKCPPTAILSEDCKCWCNTGNPGNPVVEWDGQGDCRGPDHQPKDTCLDYDDSCPRWAKEGQCKSNTNYMLMNCRRSCRVCGPGAVCRNFNDRCVYWALQGECESNPGWMLSNCMMSCNVCGNTTIKPSFKECRDISDMCAQVAADGECETHPDSLLLRCPVSCRACPDRRDFLCRNWHIQCPVWADYGRCNLEPEWMRRYCPVACRHCQGGAVPDCKNYASDEDCKRWTDEGECGNNPTWMLFYCAESCRTCGTDKVCLDRRPECADFKERGWCEDKEQRVSMQFYCPVTCQHCEPKTPIKEICQNFDPDCPTWEGRGWCDSDPNLMLWHCPKACNICGKDPVCKNYNEMCEEWASSGECTANPVWMSVHCAFACKTCPSPDPSDGGSPGDGDGTDTGNGDGDGTQGDETDDTDCVDFLDRSFCGQLTSMGYCASNAKYMLPNCMRSCKMCGEGSVCRDYDDLCEIWAGGDQCRENPGYMHLFCRRACGRCGDGTGSDDGDGSGDVDTMGPGGTCPELESWCDRSPDQTICGTSPSCDTENMVTACPFACNLCGPTPTCKDYNQYCADWAKIGECNHNPGYMRIFCRASCKCC